MYGYTEERSEITKELNLSGIPLYASGDHVFAEQRAWSRGGGDNTVFQKQEAANPTFFSTLARPGRRENSDGYLVPSGVRPKQRPQSRRLFLPFRKCYVPFRSYRPTRYFVTVCFFTVGNNSNIPSRPVEVRGTRSSPIRPTYVRSFRDRRITKNPNTQKT